MKFKAIEQAHPASRLTFSPESGQLSEAAI